ncbi:hypothetical protein ACB092_06G127200 [Castanea dentata]
MGMGGVASMLLLAACIYFRCYRKMKVEALLLSSAPEGASAQHERGHRRTKNRHAEATGPNGGPASGHISITVHLSVEFSYEELATATNNFSMASKIGEGGFGAVYYAELRGKKATIKKMAMQASKEFLAELKVLTSVHHLNLFADFGFTKLSKVGGVSLPTRVMGTFGYKPPECELLIEGPYISSMSSYLEFSLPVYNFLTKGLALCVIDKQCPIFDTYL